jgi:hypothetical protein
MDTLIPLASALGLGFLAGARLYATVFAVGLLLRLQWMAPPAGWQHASALADTRILVLSGIACAIEFIADKIPWLDSAWDSIHTFIRPIGAVLVASSLFSGLDPVYQVALVLLAGGMAFSGHSAKAATRLLVNHSPEPFSNVALSLGEDALVAGGLYLLVKHPWALAAGALLFLALFAWLAPRIYRAIRAECTALAAILRHRCGEARKPVLSAAQQSRLSGSFRGRAPRQVFSAIATADLKGLRHAVGTLCLFENEAAFLSRRWGRPVERGFGPLTGIEAHRRLLLDELVLIAADGNRARFDLPAGQLEDARAEAARYRPGSGKVQPR